MADRKPVFDAIKVFRGGVPFLPDDVKKIDLFLDQFEGKPIPKIIIQEPAPHKTLKASTIKAAWAGEREYKVPSAVSLAQYALESAWGKKNLGVHNYGGIKVASKDYANGKPTVPYIELPTREVINGKSVMMNQNFRAFKDEEEYFLYHAKLLATAPVYASAMAKLPDIGAFVRTMGAKYATDPNYANALINIMVTSKLMQYNLNHYTGI